MVCIPTQERGNEKRQAGLGHLRVWNFGYCDLFDICDLLFNYSTKITGISTPRRGRNSEMLYLSLYPSYYLFVNLFKKKALMLQ